MALEFKLRIVFPPMKILEKVILILKGDSSGPKVGKTACVQEVIAGVSVSLLDSSQSYRVITIKEGSSIKKFGF